MRKLYIAYGFILLIFISSMLYFDSKKYDHDIIYLYNPSCKYCQETKPVIDHFKDIKQIDVTTDEGKDFATEYKIKGVPVIIKNNELFYYDGNINNYEIMVREMIE